jgi:nicotinamidase-related amidase
MQPPRPGEIIIPPNGPNKFLPYDLDFHRYPDFDLDRILSDHGIKTIITVGTQVQTAVLHTAAEAALRGYKVIVPVDGMSGDSLWHLTNTQRVHSRPGQRDHHPAPAMRSCGMPASPVAPVRR